MKMNTRLACALVLAVTVMPLSAPAPAAEQPGKPIRFVVGFPPGGAGDLMGRIAGQILSEELRQVVIIDNRAGAGGIIGADIVAKSTPDGHTLFLATTGAISISPNLQPKMPYHPVRDFSPVGMIGHFQNVVTVPAGSAAASLKELVEIARRQPGKLNFASTGTGATPHLAGEMLKIVAGIDIVHVPYKGNGPAMTDLMTGRVQLMFPTLPSGLPHVKAGKLRALAVTGGQRDALLPDVPTVAEAGWPGYEVVNWFGVLAAAGTPSATVLNLNKALTMGLNRPEARGRLTSQGVTPRTSTPAELATFISRELAKWGKVIKTAKIVAE